MHQYMLDIFMNDENGNPTKGRVTTIFKDTPAALEVEYNRYHDQFQVDEEGQKTACRVYTCKVNQLCYKEITKPADFFAQFHA